MASSNDLRAISLLLAVLLICQICLVQPTLARKLTEEKSSVPADHEANSEKPKSTQEYGGNGNDNGHGIGNGYGNGNGNGNGYGNGWDHRNGRGYGNGWGHGNGRGHGRGGLEATTNRRRDTITLRPCLCYLRIWPVFHSVRAEYLDMP